MRRTQRAPCSGGTVEVLDRLGKEIAGGSADPTSRLDYAVGLARLGRCEDAIDVLIQLMALTPKLKPDQMARARALLQELRSLVDSDIAPTAPLNMPVIKPTAPTVASRPVVTSTPRSASRLQHSGRGASGPTTTTPGQDLSNEFFGPSRLSPTTLAQICSSEESWRSILSFHGQLASDEYVAYVDRFYRESFARFGKHWFYLDIVNVLFVSSQVVQPRNYLEIGVRRGRSVCAVARACPDVNILACDMWQENYAGMENPGPEFVNSELKKHGHRGKIDYLNGDSHETLPAFFAKDPDARFDLITVDGDHSEQGAYDDLCNVVSRLNVGGVLVFDDIAHPLHPYLLNVWQRVVEEHRFLASYEYTEIGYGVAFAVRMRG